MASDEPWVGIPEVAAHLHVSTDTAYRWVDTQGLSAHRVARLFRIDRTRVAFELSVADDEVDLDAGLLIAPSAIPEKPSASSSETTGGNEDGEDTGQSGDSDDSGEHPSSGEGSGAVDPTGGREIAVSFVADQKNLYDAWNALANLADVAGTISMNATATAPEGTTRPSWRTACSSRCANSDSSTMIAHRHHEGVATVLTHDA